MSKTLFYLFFSSIRNLFSLLSVPEFLIIKGLLVPNWNFSFVE